MIILILVINFIFTLFLSFAFVGSGSDHDVYKYTIQLIRENKRKSVYYHNNFLNKTSTLNPQLFYKLLSFLSSKGIKVFSFVLNPLIISILLLIFYFFINQVTDNEEYATAITALLAVNPQYFNVNNARLYGLNARAFGLILVFVFFICVYFTEYEGYSIRTFLIGSIINYLIWNISLFAQQAVVFFSMILGIVFNFWSPILMTVVSLVIYALTSYKDFIHFPKQLYNRSIVFIVSGYFLKDRYSIWRDLFWDFWVKLIKSPKKSLRYIYSSPLFIIIILNPFLIMLIYLIIEEKKIIGLDNTLKEFAFAMTITGVITFIFTSFRITRFLGEPDRYIEMIIPFLVVIPGIYLYQSMTIKEYLYLIGILALVIGLQCYLYYRKIKTTNFSLFIESIPNVKKIITTKFREDDVRFTSNNPEWTRRLLNTHWSFLLNWPESMNVGSIGIKEIVDNPKFPCYENKLISKFIEEFDINVYLHDHKVEEEFLHPRADKYSAIELDKNSIYSLYRIEKISGN
ncbi:MAG: hypothetical protein GDA42_12935 [Ekhidna sp.]|nr:hypothetical protein [Ekhidna sp.]